jgi:hypothetical protein
MDSYQAKQKPADEDSDYHYLHCGKLAVLKVLKG